MKAREWGLIMALTWGTLLYADKTHRKEEPSLTTETRSNTEKGRGRKMGGGLGLGGAAGDGQVAHAHLAPAGRVLGFEDGLL